MHGSSKISNFDEMIETNTLSFVDVIMKGKHMYNCNWDHLHEVGNILMSSIVEDNENDVT